MKREEMHFQGCLALRGWGCTCGGVTPEYYEQKLKDCRTSHEHATSMLNRAEKEQNGARTWEWKQERLRLAAIYADTQRKLRELEAR